MAIPRIRGADLERFVGRDVQVVCSTQGAQMVSNNLLRVTTADGVALNVFLPHGERISDRCITRSRLPTFLTHSPYLIIIFTIIIIITHTYSPFLLLQGKVQDHQTIHCMQQQPIGSLHVEPYNQAMDLAATKYAHLFHS